MKSPTHVIDRRGLRLDDDGLSKPAELTSIGGIRGLVHKTRLLHNNGKEKQDLKMRQTQTNCPYQLILLDLSLCAYCDFILS